MSVRRPIAAVARWWRRRRAVADRRHAALQSAYWGIDPRDEDR